MLSNAGYRDRFFSASNFSSYSGPWRMNTRKGGRYEGKAEPNMDDVRLYHDSIRRSPRPVRCDSRDSAQEPSEASKLYASGGTS